MPGCLFFFFKENFSSACVMHLVVGTRRAFTKHELVVTFTEYDRHYIVAITEINHNPVADVEERGCSSPFPGFPLVSCLFFSQNKKKIFRKDRYPGATIKHSLKHDTFLRLLNAVSKAWTPVSRFFIPSGLSLHCDKQGTFFPHKRKEKIPVNKNKNKVVVSKGAQHGMIKEEHV